MENKKDLTRIEDLANFTHEEDTEANALFADRSEDKAEAQEDLTDLDDMEDEAEQDLFEDSFSNGENAPLNFEEITKEEEEEEEEENEDEELEVNFQDENNSPEELEVNFEEDFNVEDNQEELSEEDDLEELEVSFEDVDDETEERGEREENFEVNFQDTQSEVITEEEEEEEEDLVELAEEILEPTPLALEQEVLEDPPTKADQDKEFLKDITHFAEKMIYGDIVSEGSPAFSIKLTHIAYREDADHILMILREHKFITDKNEKVFVDGLENGAILIGHISEYAAIYLCHRFRRLKLEMEMGPSEEIHHSTNYARDNFSPISKNELTQNKSLEKTINNLKIDSTRRVISSIGPTIENYSIVTQLGPSHCRKLIHSSVIIENDQATIDEIYENLLAELEEKALHKKGNGITHLSYSLNPMTINNEEQYQITCSGNIVLREANN